MMSFTLSFLTSLAALLIPFTILPGFAGVSPALAQGERERTGEERESINLRGEGAQGATDNRAPTDLDSELEQIREPASAVLFAVFLYEEAKYEMALKVCDRAIELAPNYSHAYVMRGRIYSALKEEDKALTNFSRAIELEPNLLGVRLLRGRVYYERQEYEKSLADYDRAIEIYPNNGNAYNSRGNVYLARQDYDRALADFSKSIELSNRENLYIPYRNRGLTYYYRQEYEKALADLDRAIELKPDYAYAYFNRGLVYYRRQDYNRAIADFDRAIELKPDYSDARLNLENVRRALQP